VEKLIEDALAGYVPELAQTREMLALAQGFTLHPLAAKDITDIWRFIASDSPQAAGRVR
jgi:hypothetical protein